MEQNIRIQQLEDQVRELLDWKAQRERQQITYPLDAESLPALTQHYVKKIVTDSSGGQIIAAGLRNTTIASQRNSAGNYNGVISVGEETIDKQGGDTSSLNTQLIIQDQPGSASPSFQSFIFSYRKPFYVLPAGVTISVTNGATTLTDTTKNWTVDELAGAMVNIYNSSGVHQFTRQIASNTATVVTIDGTWPAGVTDGTYTVFVPTYLGVGDVPWRRLIVGGDDVSSGGTGAQRRVIRMGFGTTGGTETLGIFIGSGSPESVITANVGSLYLRTDGGATTTLYVKTSGTGNTGWTAK